MLNEVHLQNSFATLATVDRTIAASKVETLPGISTFSHFKFVENGVEARVTWDHPRFTFFGVAGLRYCWPHCKIASRCFTWTDVDASPLNGSDMPQQPAVSVPPAVTGSASIVAAAHAQHVPLPGPDPAVHATPFCQTAPGRPPDEREDAPVSKGARVHQRPVCNDELAAVVEQYIARLATKRFQGAYGFIQLLDRAGVLPCPVIIVQLIGENGACVYMAGEAKAGKNIYLRYSRNAARSNQGHYDIYRYRSHDSVYLIDHNDASLENFAAANQVFDAAQYATAKKRLVDVSMHKLSIRSRAAQGKMNAELTQLRIQAELAEDVHSAIVDAVESKLEVCQVRGDGRCLFHSLALATNLSIAGESACSHRNDASISLP